MYIKISFQECKPNIICISDATNISPPSYAFPQPLVVDKLPENTLANTVIQTDSEDKNKKCYYIDCENTDIETVNRALTMFHEEEFQGIPRGLYVMTPPEIKGLYFIQEMKQALTIARLQHKQTPKDSDLPPYISNRNLLFAAGAVTAIGIVAAIIHDRHSP